MQLSSEEQADMAKQRTTGKVPPEMERHPPKVSSRKTMCELEGPYNLWASLIVQLVKNPPSQRIFFHFEPANKTTKTKFFVCECPA